MYYFCRQKQQSAPRPRLFISELIMAASHSANAFFTIFYFCVFRCHGSGCEISICLRSACSCTPTMIASLSGTKPLSAVLFNDCNETTFAHFSHCYYYRLRTHICTHRHGTLQPNDWALQIKHVTPVDEGLYECQVRRKWKCMQSRAACHSITYSLSRPFLSISLSIIQVNTDPPRSQYYHLHVVGK